MKELILWLAGVVGIVLLCVSVAVLSAYMEARTYRKLTGKDVTTWDALWVDLRVMDQPVK